MITFKIVKNILHKIPEKALNYIKGIMFNDYIFKDIKDRKKIQGEEKNGMIWLYKNSNILTFYHEVGHTIIDNQENYYKLLQYLSKTDFIHELFANAFEQYCNNKRQFKRKHKVEYNMITYILKNAKSNTKNIKYSE